MFTEIAFAFLSGVIVGFMFFFFVMVLAAYRAAKKEKELELMESLKKQGYSEDDARVLAKKMVREGRFATGRE